MWENSKKDWQHDKYEEGKLKPYMYARKRSPYAYKSSLEKGHSPYLSCNTNIVLEKVIQRQKLQIFLS